MEPRAVGTTYRNLFFVGAAWTALLIIPYRLEIKHQDQLVYDIALSEARALFQQVVDTGEWNSSRQGVYVKVGEGVTPNPYLEIAGRDVVTPDGETLTRVMHAQMAREIAQIGQAKRGNEVTIRVTSLEPLRPGNAPTLWEAAALRTFANGATEQFGFYLEKDKGHRFRFMRPVLEEPSCLECHRDEMEAGAQGGISVSFPVEGLMLTKASVRWKLELALSFVWLLGLGIMFAVTFSFAQKRSLLGKLRELALVNDLTGLHNRRGFLALAEKQFETAQRTGEHALLLFTDVDGLKQINDSYGHDEGDNALVLAAQALKSSFRGSDIVARFGGDEFVAFLPGCPGEFAELILARLRARVDAVREIHQKPYELSLCVGLAELDPASPVSLEDLLREADSNMYAAKDDIKPPRSTPLHRLATADKREPPDS